jgi:uncharacterized protein involved in outer membrane biogenesis
MVLGGLFLLGVIAWAVLLPSIVVSTLRNRTGFGIRIDHLSVNVFTAKVDLEGVVVENPEGWPEKDFLEIRQLRVTAELFSLFSDRLVIDDAVLDVAKITLVTDAQGRSNALLLKNGPGKPETAPKEAPAPAAHRDQKFLIKHLVLKCDQLVYCDYSNGRHAVKSYDLRLNRELRDVDSVAKLINPLTGSALSIVANALNGAGKGSPDALKDVLGTLQDAGRKTGETLKNLFHSLENKKP